MQSINADNAPLKKKWAPPELLLIGTNQITAPAKTRNQVRESTGHVVNQGGSIFFMTPLHGTGLRLTTQAGGTVSHISSAIS
jgi:hypothetical protein